MGASEKEKIALFLLNNNVCAFRGCNNTLVVKDYDLDNGSPHIAVAAHIKGEKPDAARYDPDYPENKLNSHENLIALCPTCHEKIDKNQEKYSVEMLIEMKHEHEEAALNYNIHKVTFSHLDVAAQAIATDIQKATVKKNDYDFTAIDEKIKINHLTENVRNLIKESIFKSNVVENYLSDQNKIDNKFSDKLIKGFKEEYEFFSREYHGDRLFFRMKRWVEEEIDYNKVDNYAEVIAAAFVILCHLFEKCEVFEK